jgi:hypothetical protein
VAKYIGGCSSAVNSLDFLGFGDATRSASKLRLALRYVCVITAGKKEPRRYAVCAMLLGGDWDGAGAGGPRQDAQTSCSKSGMLERTKVIP